MDKEPYKVKIGDHKLIFNSDEVKKMKQLGITRSLIVNRFKNGWPRFYIVNQPKRMSRKDFDKMIAIRKQNLLSKQRRSVYKKELQEKRQQEKLHLKKYPQKVKASKYYFDLLNFATKAFKN
ncbi:SA1788 family PVL leukocidin-associated protein [Staphylococcus pasteuri]|uniref:SA1788 family PVL leukocidin-associated protein n=1 Tax=Bacillati TaxID=1783272 RepID=UPI00086B6D79|nr:MULTISPECIES: SA1788 family PVL leukocidin-associated protein [Staphylococcus]ODB57628.1 hypothetical protein A9N02_07710 [Staphylococcus sp. AOAB]RQX28688.1 hypothetical protein DB792_02815 [Staphylococcus warneri]MCO0860520.1 hypothetical protein [Staphylococcus pasteuri]MCO5359287.1 hypothetical protein [Staphylococcus pasteuri]OFV13323.1 hypothetical protein HMPREF3125_00585 [Staphylococcus sp. HMSC13A10]